MNELLSGMGGSPAPYLVAAFLALGYFGAPGTPEKLDRIAIDAVRNAILKAAQDPAVDARCIALTRAR